MIKVAESINLMHLSLPGKMAWPLALEHRFEVSSVHA